MADKKPTIYDVAKMTGVSPATVSRVLNEPEKVAQDKRQKVFDAINELGFVPKAAAVVAARKMYKKICVVAPFFSQSSFMERLRGVEEVLNDKHFEIVIYSIQTEEDLNDYIRMITTSNMTDGMILFSLVPNEKSQELLRNAAFPVCFVESSIDGFDNVVINNESGGRLAAEYFYSKGCRNPAFIGEKSNKVYTVPATDDRFRGFKKFFSEKGIGIPEKNVWIGEFSKSNIDKEVRRFLSQDNLPDCVFCSSDLVALSFMSAAKDVGVRVPEDMKVLGFDNIDIAKFVGLSTISQSLDESGRVAAECILSRLKKSGNSTFSILVPINVIERKTT
ncbi:MAG: LacI family transcriptional regulator [Treponema sp.]|nr:LacI family transcriptional regulator [Treponema sp.]